MSTAQSSPQIVAALDDAVAAARRGHRGANPLVGAVVLGPDGSVLATGYHRGRGTDHAEVDALRVFADRATAEDLPALADCTLVITLEPCDHTGVTGPCSQAILAAGVGTVRYAVHDPTGTEGGGAARLRRAGIDVAEVPGHRGAEELNSRWHQARVTGRPFVTAHLAQTLDGRVAAADGTSQWITGAASRAHAHEVRSRVDAIVVGTGTVVADDPRLTARDADGLDLPVQPLPIVQGLREIPPTAALRRRAWHQVHSHDPHAVLEDLAQGSGQRPVRHLLIEGGPTVLSAWVAAGLVDEMFVYQAPLALGEGPSGLAPLGVNTLSQAHHFTLDPAENGPVRQLGQDILIHLAPTEFSDTQENHVHRNHH